MDKIKITMGKGRRQKDYYLPISKVRDAIKEMQDKEDKKRWCK